ncbi:MAG: glycosyltransferase family 4 protein [Betaproteobacteria bacterium]|nr:glycosyltransferase family 4 protein [Betaproteobacteria bacterium]
MKLALVRQRYNPYGGAERFVERAVAALEREGADVTVISRAWSGDARRVMLVDPFYIGRWWRDAGFARAARAAWQHAGFALVQSHERIPGASIYRAGDGVHRQWLEHRARHASPFERLSIALNPYHRYVRAAEKSMFEHPALRAVICNSNMVRAEILRHFAIAEDKLHVIYNGVDTVHFHPRERVRRNGGDIALVFAGSGFARKGLDTVLTAMARSRLPLTLVVVGRDRELPRFAALTRSLKIDRRVTFVGGVEDVRPHYAAADVLVLPTLYDPFPNVVLEAMAMGLPAIVSDQCGAAELVKHGKSGWIVPARNAAALCDALDLLEDRSQLGRAGEAARAAVEPHTIEAMAARLLALYRGLVQ